MAPAAEVGGCLRKASGAKLAPPDQGAAFVVAGAGSDDANGLYAATGKVLHGAPVYENDRKCLISREPHSDQRTGQTSYGWILGQDRRPLYAVQSESLTPPASGWRAFRGALPLPRVSAAAGGAAAAARAVAGAWKDEGKDLFVAHKYDEASAKWTRALGLVGSAADDDGTTVALYSNRAEVKLRQQDWEGALCDAEASLELDPSNDKAQLRAAVAARELKQYPTALYYVQQCLANHPTMPDAQQLLAEVEQLIELRRKKLFSQVRSTQAAPAAGDAAEGEVPQAPRAFAAKDRNSMRGFKAFSGYGEARAPSLLPLSSLPYHHMGLPPEEVESMDQQYKELRDAKDEAARRSKEALEAYERVRAQYRVTVRENVRIGSLKPLEELLPSAVEAAEPAAAAAEGAQAPRAALQEAAPLGRGDTDEIDKLFKGYEPKADTAPAEAGDEAGRWKEQLRKGNEQLEKSKIPASGKPEEGRAAPVPEPPPKNKVEKLRQILVGDDGKQLKPGSLDDEGKRLLEALKAYDQSKSEAAESKLDEFAHLIV